MSAADDIRRRTVLCAAMAAGLIGCQSPPPRAAAPPDPPPERATLPTPGSIAQHGDDGTYDWHGLLIAPFGTVLKAVPLTLHEVLLFRDEAHATGPEDSAAGASDCYGADDPAPSFAGRTPDEYVLCFARDRLARIQASVRLTAAEAPGVFAAACAAWLKNAAPAETQVADVAVAACAGHDGDIRFNGHLAEATDRSDVTPGESTMSIVLESVADP